MKTIIAGSRRIMKTKPRVPFMLGRGEQCECALCQRTRQFNAIVKRLPKKDRDWLEFCFNSMFDSEAELEMANAYIGDLKNEIKSMKQSMRKANKPA